MIEKHMRRAGEAVIDDLVGNTDLIAPDIRLDAPQEMQVLAKDCRLLHHAFRPENTAIAIPMLAIAGQTRRNGAHPAMQ
jgi:hypothetical protein